MHQRKQHSHSSLSISSSFQLNERISKFQRSTEFSSSSFALSSRYNAAQIDDSDDNSRKILWAEFRQRSRTVSAATHVDVLRYIELILLTTNMMCEVEKSITSWSELQWVLLSNLMCNLWNRDRAHQLNHRSRTNYFVAKRSTIDEARKIMCNSNLVISSINWQTQLYDSIKQYWAQIMFQIQDVVKNHYVFYKKVNTSNYVVRLLVNDNFISSDIEKINIFTDVMRWLTCT